MVRRVSVDLPRFTCDEHQSACHFRLSRFSTMATEEEEEVERGAKMGWGRLFLYTGCFFALVFVVCACTSIPMFFSERSKEKNYVEESCIVRSASYRIISRCKVSDTGTRQNRPCYVPVWNVDYGRNGTNKAVIEGTAASSYADVEPSTEKYRVSLNRCLSP